MKKTNIIRQNGYLIHIVAGVMIVCLLFADASLYMELCAEKSPVSENDSVDTLSEDEYVIVEDHELDNAWADGNYSDENSDNPNEDKGTLEINEYKHLFNILEIVPTEKKAAIGFTIAGQEPFTKTVKVKDEDGVEREKEVPLSGFALENGAILATAEDMREAYMDAILNPYPGISNGEDSPDGYKMHDLVMNFPQKLAEEGSMTYAYSADLNGTYDGYYKWVGENNGVFAKAKKIKGKQDYIMKSKFYNYKLGDFAEKTYEGNTKYKDLQYEDEASEYKYNYIFVYGYDGFTEGRDIKVHNHKRIRYENKDRFIKDIIQPDEGVENWKKTHEIKVNTRAPQNVTEADIENADLIVVNNANSNEMDYYKYTLPIFNRVHKCDLLKTKHKLSDTDLDEDKNVHFYDPTLDGDSVVDKNGKRIDFVDFEKTLQIYERVVVRQDVAFSASKLSLPPSPENGTSINTNLRKLMIMLFYVKKDGEDFAGREFFTDFLKRYTCNPGEKYMKLRKQYDDNKVKKVKDGIEYYEADPKYPDYRAMSLRSTENKDDPAYYYMHYHTNNHVGHPLVLNKEDAITGGKFSSDGVLIPLNYQDNVDSNGNPRNLYPIKLERYTRYVNMFNDPDKNYSIPYNTNTYNDTYYHDDAYESMSNTTDYVYIADSDDSANGIHAGDLVIDEKYSSKSGVYKYTVHDSENDTDTEYSVNGAYWFKIDPDGAVGNSPHAFRRRLWDDTNYSVWPWDGDLSVWLMKRTDETQNSGYNCNMHLWYDYTGYFVGSKYTGRTGDPPINDPYFNQVITGESGMLKSDFLRRAIKKRKLKREDIDDDHLGENIIENIAKPSDYYISMNILNGDGYNTKTGANKTIYFNMYEKNKMATYESQLRKDENNRDTKQAQIPIKIRIKSSCKLDDISVYVDGVPTISYKLNTPLKDYESRNLMTIDKRGVLTAEGVNSDNYLFLTRKDGTYKTNSDESEYENGIPVLRGNDNKIIKKDETDFNHLKYTFEGTIHDLFSPLYVDKRNTNVKVVLSVTAPDGSPRKVEDEITLVRRDFFMLN